MQFKWDSYYVLTKKQEPEQFSTILIQGVWLAPYEKIEQRYDIREATLAEATLQGKPFVDETYAKAKISELRSKKPSAYYK